MNMRRFLHVVLGAIIVFAILGGVSALPIATRALATLSAQQVPVSLEAFQAIPKKYRQEVLAAMTPDAIASIANQHWDLLLASEDTSEELKAILRRLKPLHTAARVVKGRQLMATYQSEHKKWRDGLRATEPDISGGYEPEVWAELKALRQLPPEEQAKVSYLNLPETLKKEESPVSIWLGASLRLKHLLDPAALLASAEWCRCVTVEIGPMPCDDSWCFQIYGMTDMYCERGCEDHGFLCPPYVPCNGGCRNCY